MLILEVALCQVAVMAPNQSPFADGTRARTQSNLGQHNSATLRIAYIASRLKLSQLESERWVGQHPNAPSQYFRFQLRRGTKAKFALTMMPGASMAVLPQRVPLLQAHKVWAF